MIEANETFDGTWPHTPHFFHGNGFAIDGYLPFWALLAEDFDLILFDMRNHGMNAPTGADGHHYAQMAQDLDTIFVGVNEKLGAKTNVGIFHSMSARAVMKQAIEIGWRWDALALYDPPNVPLPGHEQYEPMCAFERKLVDWAMTRQNRFSDPAELAEAMVDIDVEIEGVIEKGKLLTLTTKEALELKLASAEVKTLEALLEKYNLQLMQLSIKFQ